jgi:hypothetical protein
MRQVIALVVALALMVGAGAPAAYAGNGTGTNVALGLASFAVFNQLVGPLLHPRPRVREVVVERPVYHVVERPVYRQVYAPPSQVVVVQPSPAYPTVVQYWNGRYELRGDGVYTPYQWVWIPTAHPLPPPPPPPPAS